MCSSDLVHDLQVLDDLLDEKDKDQDLYADSAYTGKDQDEKIGRASCRERV